MDYRKVLRKKTKYNEVLSRSKKLLFLVAFFALACFLADVGEELMKPKHHQITLGEQEDFLFPTEGIITALNKSGSHENNQAVDIANELGTPIYAAFDGKVSFYGEKGTYGDCIMLEHDKNHSTLYAHLGSSFVTEGQMIKKGQKIALMGNTGNSTGPHLHFEIRKENEREEITEYFGFLEKGLTVTYKQEPSDVTQ